MRVLYVTRHFNHSGYLILESLIQEGFDIAGVLLHRSNDPWLIKWKRLLLKCYYKLECWFYRGEQLKTTASELNLARKHKLNIIWADSIKSDAFYADLKMLNPDIIVLGGGWHELIPARVFEYPELGCINTHPSLLPAFRGTSITRWQVLKGVETSGSTIHYVDDRFDTGGALAQKSIDIPSNLTPQELFYKLGELGAEIMVPLLRKFQSEGKQTDFHVASDSPHCQYFKRWKWSEEKLMIDWKLSIRELHFFVLANSQESYKYLGPTFTHRGQKYFLRKTKLHKKEEVEEQNATRSSEELHCIARTSKTITLTRASDDHCLELVSIQRFTDSFKYQRSVAASKVLNLQLGEQFPI